ncbi:MAG: DUF169 domain-containing protein [Syntrophorhabdales bacterium]|jgi:uncharacterized protein (DUF169 family)
MNSKNLDYSIFDKFNFERKPVGVGYSLKKPEGIEPLDKGFALYELFKEAQTSRPFYAVEENIECGVQILGMKEFPPIMHSGQLGPIYAMFRNPGANRRIYDYMPSLPMNSVKYVSFASFDQLTFDPDVLILTTSVSQAEIILRASSFSNGKMWSSKGTTCLACAWIYAHSYVTGELNFTVSGLGFSMKARKVLPEGLMIITVPFDLIAGLIENLKDMEWYPDWFDLGREGFIEKVKTSTKQLSEEFDL